MKSKILCIFISIILIMILGIRIYVVNKDYRHEVINYECNEDIIYNKTSLRIMNVSVFNSKDFFEEYNISDIISNKECENYKGEFSYLIYNVYLANNSSEPCYLDFEHFVLEIGHWFSWMSKDMFIELNPQMERNLKVCIYPGIETNVELPFLLYYGTDNDNFMYRQLSNGKAVLNLGIYPERYKLKTEFKNFEICS